jgi:hypothetical protein
MVELRFLGSQQGTTVGGGQCTTPHLLLSGTVNLEERPLPSPPLPSRASCFDPGGGRGAMPGILAREL